MIESPDMWNMSKAKELGFSLAATGVAVRLLVGADSPYIPYYVSLIVIGLLYPLVVNVHNVLAGGWAFRRRGRVRRPLSGNQMAP
jgi:hypothetical protein